MSRTSIAVAALVFSCLASPMAAQDADPGAPLHQGFWVGFGLGGGTNFADWADGGRAGLGAYVRLGGTISQHLLIGGEINGWARKRNDVNFTESGATAVAIFYPTGQGVFLKGGAGFAFWAQQASALGTTTTQTAGGFAGTVGVGYDLLLSGNLFLTPNLDFLYHTMESEGTAFTGIGSGAVLLFTLGLTWH